MTDLYNNDRITNKMTGNIYIIQCGEYYKIGWTTNVNSRMTAFNTIIPFEISLYKKYTSIEIAYCEKFLHERFKEKRIKGEWFKLSIEDLEWIDNFLNRTNLRYEIDKWRRQKIKERNEKIRKALNNIACTTREEYEKYNKKQMFKYDRPNDYDKFKE